MSCKRSLYISRGNIQTVKFGLVYGRRMAQSVKHWVGVKRNGKREGLTRLGVRDSVSVRYKGERPSSSIRCDVHVWCMMCGGQVYACILVWCVCAWKGGG